MLAWGMGVVAEVLEIVVAIAVLVKWVVNSLLGHLSIIVAACCDSGWVCAIVKYVAVDSIADALGQRCIRWMVDSRYPLHANRERRQ